MVAQAEELQASQVRYWVAARLNQEFGLIVGRELEDTRAAILEILARVLQEARDKNVPDHILAEIEAHFRASVRVNGEELPDAG